MAVLAAGNAWAVGYDGDGPPAASSPGGAWAGASGPDNALAVRYCARASG